MRRKFPKTCMHCSAAFDAVVKAARFCSKRCGNLSHSKPVEERFWSRVDKEGPVVRAELGNCWDWKGPALPAGYGNFYTGGTPRMELAHRFAWKLANGPIPDGLYVLHACDRPACVRHLFLGTALDNVRDMIAKGRDDHARGERQRSAKLCPCAIRAMRTLWRGGVNQPALARRFNVHPSSVSRIVRGEQWRHVA